MNTFPLSNNWTVEYFEPNIDGFEMAPSPQMIDRIEMWNCSGRFVTAGFYAYLRREFQLEMTDYCVRYFLLVENAPPTTRIYVNDKHLASGGSLQALQIDITDAVSLGTNKIHFRVDCSTDGECRFDAVSLLQVDCEEI